MSKKWRLEFLQDPEAYARTSQSQRKHAREIADLLSSGDSLDSLDTMARGFVASILRSWADNLSDKPPRKPGQAPQVDAANIALHFECLNRKGMSKNKAREKLAETYGVSVETIRNALKKQGEDARRFMDFVTQPTKQKK